MVLNFNIKDIVWNKTSHLDFAVAKKKKNTSGILDTMWILL